MLTCPAHIRTGGSCESEDCNHWHEHEPQQGCSDPIVDGEVCLVRCKGERKPECVEIEYLPPEKRIYGITVKTIVEGI